MGGVLARRGQHPPRDLGPGPRTDRARLLVGLAAFRCDSLGCIGTVKGKTVALIRQEGAVEEDCRIADIVIAPFTIGQRCRAARVIVDRRVLKAEGAQRSILRACRSGPRRSRPGAGIGLGFPIGPA